MNILFVTGSDAAFFNSLLICLQSFAERMPGHRLLVCDFGLTRAQAEFLRSLDLLLPRPAELAGHGAFHCKAGLARYLQRNGQSADNAVVWLDADITLMHTGLSDFQAVLADMTSSGAQIAACGEPSGRNIGQTIALFSDAATIAPFARMVAEMGIDPSLSYLCTGLFFCRSSAFLERWAEVAAGVRFHPLFDQNLFNVVLHRDVISFLTLDCEEWQAYGRALDAVSLVAATDGGRPAARIGARNVKMLHTTSSEPSHLLIGNCRMTVRQLDLTGPFKLFLAEPLRLHQLQLLASFVVIHGEALLRLGLCTPAARQTEGFEFATL
jgi:hypothetical protein